MVKKSDVELERVKLHHERTLFLMDRICTVAYHLITVAGWAAGIFFMGDALKPFAGTDTNVLVDAVLSMSADRWVAYSVAAVTGAGYLVERRTRIKTEKNMRTRIFELEDAVDPNRSRSGLD